MKGHPVVATRTKSWALDGLAAPDVATGYAMNMRTADASVRSPPKPMKIFPIMEALSHAELSSLPVVAGSYGGTAEAIAIRRGGALGGSMRSTSLS